MNISKCPKCGNPTDLSDDSCRSCGIIFSRYYASRITGVKKNGENNGNKGRIRLVFDILLGIFGLSMIFSGFVVIFVACFGQANSAVNGGTPCLVLGAVSFTTGIISALLSAYGIARSIR